MYTCNFIFVLSEFNFLHFSHTFLPPGPPRHPPNKLLECFLKL